MTNLPTPPTAAALALENEELRHRLREAEELIAAVRTGAVDALAIQGPEGPRIFTLESADQSYRALIEQMNEGALLLSPEGTVLYCNAALAALLGQAPAALLGNAFEACVPADFQDYWAGLVARGWAGKARGELPLRGPEGALRPCAVSMNGLNFDGAQALAVLVTDVSAAQEIDGIRALVVEQDALIERAHDELLRQQAARHALEQVAAEVGRVLEGIPQIAWTSDPAGTTSYLNRRWFDFAGEGPTAGLGPITSRIHPADFVATTAHWHHCLATGAPLDVECRLRNAAGHYRWMLGRALPSRDEDGTIREWIGTFTDIHEQKLALERVAQAQALLRANNEQLTRVNEDLDNFVYTASHDLKGPITNIEGLLQALLVELPPASWEAAQVPAILDMMQDSVDRFRRTIEHLTAVIEVQKAEPLAHAPADVQAVIADVRLDLAPELRAAGGRLEVDANGCEPLPFAEKNLRSVVYNLLSNAIKYRAPGRALRVRLSCHTVGNEVVLAVQDNGLGLDLADEPRLFAMFQRLHDHVEGSGIGLYMVKKLVENAGGRIAVQSQLGVGSTFTVHFRR
ncbi:sensor histidine kinase [Hymenobacter nivis]|uniref:histidine kinase n=1 Tax=Hymenobacter nivis TaxID=1850093 RepID=A0A502GYV4_9BACT|nr:ATP-binding protein [Hymenobacter nivis]TPG67587.1 PAS domain-containing protein [Hymenobacter nivis]